MTSRERVKMALDHRQPDQIPVDFGATGVTGMHVSCVAQLREYYGLEKRPVKVNEPYQMLGEIDEELQEVIGIDIASLNSRKNMFGFANDNWKEFRLPWGQEVLVPGDFNVKKDGNGDLLIYPEGDTSAPPSGRMPVGGYFFDTIVRQPPIDESKLDPADNLEEFGPISEEDLEYFKSQLDALKASNKAVIGGIGGTGLGDIAFVPAPFLKHPRGIRDVEEWYISTVMRKDYIHQVFARQVEFALKNLERFYEVVGDAIDVCFICGTDFGTQDSSFCSVETFRELYAPYYKQMNDWIHKNTPWKTFKHSCGSVKKFIPEFIECGFDILNPVQCSAKDMDPQDLKDSFGKDIVFWGGGVDTQKTLPFGTPEEVRREVLERCEIFGKDGGFVFNTIHNIQARTPLGNIVAMIDALKEFNGVK